MIRKLASILLVVLVPVLAAVAQTATTSAPLPSAPAPAANATPATNAAAPQKIGIVNIQAAIMATNEGQREFKTLEKKFEPKRAELQTANLEIENLKKQLNTQGDKLNESTRGELVKTLESKQKTLQRNVEDAQAEWQSQQNEIANRIGQKMLAVLEKYANENGYSVVLDVGSQANPVLWASASTNITKPIVEAYNAQSNVPAPTAATTPKAAAPASKTAKSAPSTTTPKK